MIVSNGSLAIFFARSGVTSVPLVATISPVRRIDDVLAQDVARQLVGLIGHLAHHVAIRRLDKAILVHPAIGRQTADQADVRAFRRLDRADAAIVAVVHVAHVKAGALAAQTAGAERRQRALVRQLGQRIGLIHELAKLAASRRTRGRPRRPGGC